MTGTQALTQAVARLRAAGIDDPARDARRLLAHALALPAGRLTLVLPDPITDDQATAYAALISRRAARVPVSHLIGTRAFYGRDFIVTGDVLDPRPETEILIQEALKPPFSRVLDLGTGSGCIALTLLAERPETTALATDLSADAVRVARQNAARLGLESRVQFAQGAWFNAVPQGATFDLIVSNPPYIALPEMAGLSPELTHEPRMALTDEGDGLGAYRAITRDVTQHLAPQGHLMVEIGPTQAQAVAALFVAAGLSDVTTQPDLDGRDRVVIGVLTQHTKR